jgi:hypothetical protein
MKNDPLWIKVHHEYFYKDTSLEVLKEGIHEAVNKQGLDFESVMHAALRGACKHDRLDVLDFIFSHKELNFEDNILSESMNNSFMYRSFSSVKFLLNKGAKFDLTNNSIMMVLPHCSLELLHLIREKGFDIYDPQYNLLYFSFKEYPPKYEIIEDMLKSGANFDDIESINLYHYFVSYDGKEITDLIDYVISKGFDINREDGKLLKWCISNDCEYNLSHLLSIGANTNLEESLFQFCARKNNFKMIEILEKNGLKLDPSDDRVIRDAAEYDNLKMVKFLVKKGFSFDTAKIFGGEKVKPWCIKKMHNDLNNDLTENHKTQKKSNKL